MRTKSLVVVAVLITAFLCFGGFAKAQNVDTSALIAQLQAQIASLMAQIQQLIAQQGGGHAWCHTFNANLGYADSGSGEIGYLHTVLDKEGISYASDNSNVYGEATMSAVIQLQQKYLITPLSGYVGPKTRIKLNALYGCGTNPAPVPPSTTQPSITVTSPNGGEAWQVGSSKTITWTTTNIPATNRIVVRLRDSAGVERYFNGFGDIFYGVPNSGSYSVTVPLTLVAGQYKVEVKTAVDGQSYLGTSDNYFTIASPTSCVCTFWSDWSDCVNGQQTKTCVNPSSTSFCGPQNTYQQCTPTTQPSITVTSPNGGEQITPSQYVSILWNPVGILSSDRVNVWLEDHTNPSSPNNNLQTGVACAPDYGNCNWQVPMTALAGIKYKIKVEILRSGQILTSDESNNYFTINAPPATHTQCVDQKCISVFGAGSNTCTSDNDCVSTQPTQTQCNSLGQCVPGGGGAPCTVATAYACEEAMITSPSPSPEESWQAGSTHNITWTPKGVNNITIQLKQLFGSFSITTVAQNVSASAGTYSYTVPLTLTPGEYEFLIFDAAHTSDTSASIGMGLFNVTAPATQASITVTSPNGGDQWAQGSTHDITWTATGVDKVYLFFAKYTSSGIQGPIYLVGGTSAGVSANLGTYSWTIPSTGTSVAVSDRVKVIVSSSQNVLNGTGVTDTSDNYFSIVAPTTSLNASQSSLASIADALIVIARQIQSLINR